MPIRYKVRQGDTLAKIAAQHDFTDWQALYFHPANDELRRLRPNPSFVAPGDVVQIPERPGDPNEAIHLIEFILAEMKQNAASNEVSRINELNRQSYTACISDWSRLPWWQQLFSSPSDCMDQTVSSRAAAMVLWAERVGQGRPWDHKPILRRRFGKVWHQLGRDYEFFYDIWSNIHYGYVGCAAGFSTAVLLGGAGLEQGVSDLVRGQLPQQRPGVRGLRSFDDASDQEAILIGVRLFKEKSASVDSIRKAVLSTPKLDRRLRAAPDRKLAG